MSILPPLLIDEPISLGTYRKIPVHRLYGRGFKSSKIKELFYYPLSENK